MTEQPVSWRAYILEHVEKDEETGCWTWTGSTQRQGLPVIKDDNSKTFSVRPVAYAEFCGPLPDDGLRRRIFTRCGARLCLSPEHLIALTYHEQRVFTDASKSDEVVLQIDVRENGTAYAYALNGVQEWRLKRLRGSVDLGNGEFELPPGTVRLTGMRSNEKKREWVYQARERLGDARPHSSQLSSTERGWTGFREEEEQHLGVAEDFDVG